MRYRSQVQPLCRCCAKPIKKFTVTHYFGHSHMEGRGIDGFSQYHPQEAKTKAEAQRFINERIISTRRGYGGNVVIGTWDGETYVDEFFCKGECARDFAYAAVRHSSGLAMPVYHEAIAKRAAS